MSNKDALKRDEFLADILVTAVEGGIGYWSRVGTYRWYFPDLDGGTGRPSANGGAYATALIYEYGDEEEPVASHFLCPEKIEAAVQRIIDDGENIKYLGRNVISRVVDNSHWNEWDGDSIDADQIVQVALLGEVRYG